MKTKRTMSSEELKRKYNQFMKNMVDGIQQMVNAHPSTQSWIFFILLQDCLYNKTTSPFFVEMYKRDEDFYKKETNGVLEDYQLAPLDRKNLFNGMEDLITGGGRKKFVGILSLYVVKRICAKS